MLGLAHVYVKSNHPEPTLKQADQQMREGYKASRKRRTKGGQDQIAETSRVNLNGFIVCFEFGPTRPIAVMTPRSTKSKQRYLADLAALSLS